MVKALPERAGPAREMALSLEETVQQNAVPNDATKALSTKSEIFVGDQAQKGAEHMGHKELYTIFEMIEDNDFPSAVSEMLRLAKEFSENGKPEYSDFLANFASNSYLSDNQYQKTKSFSDIEDELESLGKKYDNLIHEANTIILKAFEYFKEIESIATCEHPPRPHIPRFDSTNRDNFSHIKNYIDGDNTNINPQNIVDIFSSQVSFYMTLQPAGTRSLGNFSGRITNILPGEFWRFVEIRKSANSIKKSLSEISRINEDIAKLCKEADELRGQYTVSDISSSSFRSDFLQSLEEFHEKNSRNHLPA